MISETLRTDIETFAVHLRTSNRLFDQTRRGKVTPHAIVAYLANMTYLIREALAVLRVAQDRAKELGHADLATFYAHKIAEEKGHDQWARNDIASIDALFGVNASFDPTRAISSMLTYLRQAIDDDPVRYLSYLLFTEYLIVLIGPEWLALLEANCGVPSSSMSVVGRHIDLDKDHVVEDLREIDALVKDARHFEPLRQTLKQSMQYFENFCEEICDVTN